MRRVLVVDSGRYRNERSAALHCYMGHGGIAPTELLETTRAQLARYDTVAHRRGTVTRVERRNDFLAVVDGEEVHARSLLVATGVVDELPPVPRIEEFFGHSVHVCPYCDGWEHRGGSLAVYGRGSKAGRLALLLRQWSDDVMLCTNGPADVPNELLHLLQRRSIGVCETPIAGLEGRSGCLEAVCFADGTRLPMRSLFFHTGQHPRSTLLDQLGCAYRENSVACDEDGATNIPGAYVAGDVSRDVQLAIIAAAEGARAGLAINSWILRSDGNLPNGT
jgi:thioredoxin reductase